MIYDVSSSSVRASVVVVQRGPQLTPADWQELVSGLPWTERHRLDELHRWEDRQDSAIGWHLLHQLAGERGVRVRRGANGRPCSDPPVDVSLSHGGGWIAAAACGTGRTGIDVETLRDVAPSLARRCLSAAESAWLERARPGVHRSYRFLRLWTAKEAYLKATGVGLAADPREISIDHTGDEPQLLGSAAGCWRFSSSTPAPGVCVSMCVECAL